MDKRKRFKLNLEIFRDIFKIYPCVQGQDFDALPTDEEIVSFLRELGHTREINSLNDVVIDHMHQPWRTFAAFINKSLSGKTTSLDKLCLSKHKSFGIDNKANKKQQKMYYPRFTKVIIHYFLTQDKTLSWRNKIGMHTSRDNYLINTLRFVSVKEDTQIYGAILPECLTSPEMKETQAYMTYLGFATRATPPKKEQKFKKPASPKLTTVSISIEKPTRKSKRVKRPAKKSTKASSRGVVIRESLEIPLTKKKEKGNDEDDNNNKQVSSDEDMDQEKDSDDDKTQSNNKNESNSEHETNKSKSGSESDHDENEEDEDDEEAKITDKTKGDEQIDYTISQLYDVVDIRLNEPVDIDKGFVQEEGTDAAMTNVQQRERKSGDITSHRRCLDIPRTDAKIVSLMDIHVHHEVPSQQIPTLLTVPVLIISDSSPGFSIIIPQSLPSFTPPPQQSTSTPLPITEATNPQSALPNFASAAATLIDFELKNIMIDKIDKSESYLVAPEHRECYEGLIKSYELDTAIFSIYGKVYSLKRSRKDKDKDPSTRSDRGLKKRKTSKDAELAKGPKAKESQSGSSKGDKSQSKSSGKSVQSKEPVFVVADSDMPQDQVEKPGNDDEELNEKVASKRECYKALSEKLNWENPEGGDYPFDITKPLPLVMIGNRQKVHVDYFFNNDLKYLQGGVLTMTYTTSITKTKAAQYDLPGIKDMVPNIWSPVKVEVMRKHGYGYLQEIIVRRADNDLYRFKEGDFSRLRINDIEDMLLLVVQNRLTNLLETTKYGIRKRDPYNPYQDPQGFIYVDDNGRNRLMRSDELYKFSDGTLTRLQNLLGDITKNIRMEYKPKRRWSTLEKKRANIMIKAIDKQLKERRMMRSLEKFWVSDDELEAPEESPQFLEQAPPSPDYVPGPEHPPSQDYIPGPENLPSPDYVLGAEYPQHLVPSDDEVPIEDQPLPADASL
nr:hypothetical protein [Tanacetum cinerariifolium]